MDHGLLLPLSWLQAGSELGEGVSVGTEVGSCCSPICAPHSTTEGAGWGTDENGGVGALGQVLRKMDRKPGNEFPSGPTVGITVLPFCIRAALLQ